MLNTMPLRTIRAEDASDKTVKVEATIASTLNDGKVTEVSGKVYSDFSFLIELPNEAVNSSNATVRLRMKDIASLNISGERQMSYTLTTNQNIEKNLYEVLKAIAGSAEDEHLFGFDGVKVAVSVKADGKQADTEYQVSGSEFTEASSCKQISATVNADTARAAWMLITEQLDAGTKAGNDSYIVIANGSYMQLGREKLVFEKDGDLKLDNLLQTKDLIQLIRDYVKLEDTQDSALVFALKAGSELAVGESHAVLNTDVKMTVEGCDVAELNILSNLESGLTDGDERQLIIGLLEMANTVLGKADAAESINVLVDFDYRVDWQWSDDFATATARFYSPVDDTLVGEKTVDTVTTVEPNCKTAGEYSAEVEFEGVRYTARTVGKVDPDAHDYKAEFDWSGSDQEGWKAEQLLLVCQRDTTHVSSVAATTEVIVTKAGCEAEGNTAYIATAEYEGETYTETKNVVIPATGHDYDYETAEAQYTWDFENMTLTGRLACGNAPDNRDHDLVETIAITAEEREASAAEPAKTIYRSAEFSDPHFRKQRIEVPHGERLDYKFIIRVSSQTKDGETGAVTGTVYPDYRADLVIDQAMVSVSNATVDVWMKNVASLGVEGERHHDVTVHTDLGDREVSLELVKDLFAGLQTAAIVAKVKDSANSVTYTLKNEGWKITATPNDTFYARKVWQEIVNSSNVTVEDLTQDDSRAEIKKGSYIQAGGKKLMVTADLTLNDLNDTTALMKAIKDAVTLTDEEAVKGVEIYLEEGTQLTIGSSKASVVRDSRAFIRVYDEAALADIEATLKSLQGVSSLEDVIKGGLALVREVCNGLNGKTTEVEFEFGHRYEQFEFLWSEDHKSAELHVTCLNNDEHVQIIKATVEETVTKATCEQDGKAVYTATAEFEGEQYSETYEEITPALGHKWSEPSWIWSNDRSMALAFFTCEHDATHIRTVEAVITVETTAPNCGQEGKTVYTATATFEGQQYTDTYEETSPALVHDYQLTEWIWAADYSSAVARFVCRNDASHIEDVPASISSEGEPATCLEAGVTIYIASVSFEGKKYADVKEVEIPATGHLWGEPVIEWKEPTAGKPYPDEATATRVCQHDASHRETVECEVTVLEEGDDYITLKATGTFADGTTCSEEKTFDKDKLALTLAAMSTEGIELSWTDIGADKYELYRDDVLIATVIASSYLDDVGRTMGKEYRYQVRGIYEDSVPTGYSLLTVVYNPFVEDIVEGTDTFTHVAWAYNAYIVDGISNSTTRFGPEGRCTRTQFALMLWRMNNKPDVTGLECPFEDLEGLTANNRRGIIWCYNNDIIKGTSPTTFAPKGKITRTQLCLMLYRMADMPSVAGLENPFTDISDVSANNRKAIIWCYHNGLIDGITETEFQPTVKGTRAELVRMLYVFETIYHTYEESR
jgi:hypothetical protein